MTAAEYRISYVQQYPESLYYKRTLKGPVDCVSGISRIETTNTTGRETMIFLPVSLDLTEQQKESSGVIINRPEFFLLKHCI